MTGMLGFAVKHAHDEAMLRLLGASELEFRETAHKISNDSRGSIAGSGFMQHANKNGCIAIRIKHNSNLHTHYRTVLSKILLS